MNEELISFKIAKIAKTKGFDFIYNVNYFFYNEGKEGHIDEGVLISEKGEVISYKNKDDIIQRPTQSLLAKWLRDQYEIFITVIPYIPQEGKLDGCWTFIYAIQTSEQYKLKTEKQSKEYRPTYEKALEEGLYEALKLIP